MRTSILSSPKSRKRETSWRNETLLRAGAAGLFLMATAPSVALALSFLAPTQSIDRRIAAHSDRPPDGAKFRSGSPGRVC